MRPPKLYLKFFLSFTLLLIVTELLIFGLFKVTEESSIRERIGRYTLERVLLLKEWTEERLRSGPDRSLTGRKDIQEFINHIAKINASKVWMTEDNHSLYKSFQEEIPGDIINLPEESLYRYGDIRIYQDFNEVHDIYAISPVRVRGQGGLELHIYLGERERRITNTGFTLGLAGIGIIIAVLVIPISRFISERVKQLKQSALRIASGDLSYRIDIKGRDEIGELGNAFNQMADKVERMIVGGKALTALVSHELRTPLTRIRIAEVMLREKLEKEKAGESLRHLDDIREDIGLLDDLIGRILELSKIDMHEVRFEMEQFDIAGLLNDLLHQLKPIIDRKELEVKTDLLAVTGFKGNQDALSTALLNVLDNAVKFTEPKGHIRVYMTDSDGKLVIGVVNSYKKLHDGDLERIFEPFQRVGGSGASGSGLGLAITNKIIGRHGGTSMAINTADGFEVRIMLPFEK